MPELDSLPTKFAVYQNQCFDPDGNYTGFQCPNDNPDCPIKAADGLEILDALEFVGGHIELDHHDSCRFSTVGTTYADQVIARCKKCHTARHAADPSASRLPW